MQQQPARNSISGSGGMVELFGGVSDSVNISNPPAATGSTAGPIESSGSIILEEELDQNYEPTLEEVEEYARFLGLDPEKEPELLWIARQGLTAPLPSEWKPCQTADGQVYYFNFATGESIWDHPCDEIYRKMYQSEKAKQLKQATQQQQQQDSQPANHTASNPSKALIMDNNGNDKDLMDTPLSSSTPSSVSSPALPQHSRETAQQLPQQQSLLLPNSPSENISMIGAAPSAADNSSLSSAAEGRRPTASDKPFSLDDLFTNRTGEPSAAALPPIAVETSHRDEIMRRRSELVQQQETEWIEWKTKITQEFSRKQQLERDGLETEFNQQRNLLRLRYDEKLVGEEAEHRKKLERRRMELESSIADELEQLQRKLNDHRQRKLAELAEKERDLTRQSEQTLESSRLRIQSEQQRKLDELEAEWSRRINEAENENRQRLQQIEQDAKAQQQSLLAQIERQQQESYRQAEKAWQDRARELRERSAAEESENPEKRLDSLRPQQGQAESDQQTTEAVQHRRREVIDTLIRQNDSLAAEQKKKRSALEVEQEHLNRLEESLGARREEIRREEMELLSKSRNLILQQQSVNSVSGKPTGSLQGAPRSPVIKVKHGQRRDVNVEVDDLESLPEDAEINDDKSDSEDDRQSFVTENLPDNAPLSENIKHCLRQEERELERTRREMKRCKEEMRERQKRLETARKQWKTELEQLGLERHTLGYEDDWKSPYDLYKERQQQQQQQTLDVYSTTVPDQSALAASSKGPQTETGDYGGLPEIISSLRSDSVSGPNGGLISNRLPPRSTYQTRTRSVGPSPIKPVGGQPIVVRIESPRRPTTALARQTATAIGGSDTFESIGRRWQDNKEKSDRLLRDHSQWLHEFRQRIGLERTKPSTVIINK